MDNQDAITRYTRIVTQCVESYQNLSAACDKAIAAGAMDINGPLHEAIWTGFEKTLALLDVNGWISWYIYENDCGKKMLEVIIPGEDRFTPIVPGDIADIIVREL
jgi:hypothetical protein